MIKYNFSMHYIGSITTPAIFLDMPWKPHFLFAQGLGLSGPGEDCISLHSEINIGSKGNGKMNIFIVVF